MSDEREASVQLAESAAMYKSDPWKSYIESMQEVVQEAFEAMVGNVSSDPMTYMKLQIRWQQRESMLRHSLILAEDTIKDHEKELEDFKRAFEALTSEAQ